ncbi:MAG: GNAT family N-acetyltransferase [Bacteroidota bacterium]
MTDTILCSCPASQEVETIKDFSLEVFDTIENLSELQWNKQIPEANFLMRYDELKLIETTHAGSMQFRYVLAKRDGVTVGAMYFQVVMFHANQLINYFPASAETNFAMKGLKVFSEKLLNLINVKLLVSGNVFMTGENGFYFSHDLDKATRAKILRKTTRDILKSDASVKAILISDLYHPKTEFDTDFKKCGYNEIYVESDMSIHLRDEWNTFDDYMKALSSKYRVRAKKVFILCEENGVEKKDLSLDEVKLHEDKLSALYHKVMANADFKLAELSKDFFYAQKRDLPDNYHVYAYFKQGEMIGFISAFQFGKKMEVHYTGMDAEVTKPIHLYQHMMYDMIQLGIEKRAERLHFGRTAPEIKSTIGATPSPMYGYIKHRNSLFNFFVARPYTANLKPKDYVFRNPFKA